MIVIDVPLICRKDTFVGTDEDTFILTNDNPVDINIFVSGLYMTEGEDYSVQGSTITFVEAPLTGENINITYKS